MPNYRPKDLPLNLQDNIPGSKYFKWYEALWLPQVQAFAAPTAAQQANIIKQAKALDELREYFQAPIVVHSWLRPPAYNKLIGGAPQSKHRVGLATDFHVTGHSCTAVKKELMADPSLYPGRGEINTINWIHLDLSGTTWFKV